ncbi:hypothetical protein CAK95_02370 [Pseudorhodoplanes sinuspersici]|uniref:DUF2946 domain-containing protein n=2 Tax=Pseudorhodoplanes sinuspersici TaxID=1235591 RepID=A0A1W6ZL52_9HYPH|nr:hypothetical protein CAK95_02370 [Pseudorhodoplanes sinuspersici]
MVGARRYFVLILVFAFALSGLLHVGGNEHAFASAHLHEQTSISHDAGGEPCDPVHDGKSSGVNDCSVTSVCSLCAPMESSAALALSNAKPAEIEPISGHFGNIRSQQFRPPRLFPNV